MFAIEYWCGPKFGGWLVGNARYPSAEAASARIIANLKAERERDITSLFCRVRAI